MTSFLRILNKTLTPIALLLALATLALGWRSHFARDCLTYNVIDPLHHQFAEHQFRSNRGLLLLSSITRDYKSAEGVQAELDALEGDGTEPGWHHAPAPSPTELELPDHRKLTKLGFFRHATTVTKAVTRFVPDVRPVGTLTLSTSVTAVPHWFVALLLSLPADVQFILWYRRIRNRPTADHCACGYDLRATPDRCSECGTPAAPRKQ